MKTVYFYNANFNYKSSDGQYKYSWGVTHDIDLSKPIMEEIIRLSGFDKEDIFNFNLTAFNIVGESE